MRRDQVGSDEWLDIVDEQIFTFKRKVHRWLKCAEEEQQRYAMSEKSQSSKGSSSKSSHHSSISNASRRSSRCSNFGDSKTRGTIQFARIHTSLLINIEKILNRPITKFYNSDDVNVIAAELRLTRTRPISFYMKHNLSKKQWEQMYMKF